MTAKRAVVALLLTLAVTGCASSGRPSEFAPAPDRVKQATWDEHCRYRRELLDAMSRYSNGNLDSEIFLVMLLRYREGLVRNVKSIPQLGPEVREVIFGIDRLQPAVREEARFDYSEIRTAIDALPQCGRVG